MQANLLQSLMTFNARAINARQMLVEYYVDDARAERARGETAYMVDAFTKAAKARKVLAKLVANQRAMQLELKAIHRDARIASKTAKAKTLGVTFPAGSQDDLSAFEVEAGLDRLLGALITPKADSRKKAA